MQNMIALSFVVAPSSCRAMPSIRSSASLMWVQNVIIKSFVQPQEKRMKVLRHMFPMEIVDGAGVGRWDVVDENFRSREMNCNE